MSASVILGCILWYLVIGSLWAFLVQNQVFDYVQNVFQEKQEIYKRVNPIVFTMVLFGVLSIFWPISAYYAFVVNK